MEARKALLAQEMNNRMEELLHGETHWLEGPVAAVPVAPVAIGGISSQEEENELEKLNIWMEAHGLPAGELSFDCANPDTGEQRAVFDLAWPNGIQQGLTQPVVVLLNESADTLAIASQVGFRCFTSAASFKQYVEHEILEVAI
jgi:hypothetical protein